MLAFDVNFFNPKEDKEHTTPKVQYKFSREDYSIEYEGFLYSKEDTTKSNPNRVIGNGGENDKTLTLNKHTPDYLAQNWASSARTNYWKRYA